MAVQKITHLSIGERRAKGSEARDRTPPSSHAKWVPAADRPDLVALLEEQNATREPDLVPVRHGRATLQDDRRQLLERFEIVDWARKVVGVGSVGTRAFIVLLLGRDCAAALLLAAAA
jgi:hypothetical protein